MTMNEEKSEAELAHFTTRFWKLARESRAGLVVTAFPTRDSRWRARVEVDGVGFYTPERDSLSELLVKLGEDARGG